MRKMIVAGAALLALAGCVSHNFAEGQRTNYRCDGDKEFSMRDVAGMAEVYASGQNHQLPATGEGQYSNGEVTYTESGGRASLTGLYNGPFENCRGRAHNSWLPNFW
jgi:hypothetical protein